MATYEQELKRFEPVIRRLTFLILLGKRVEVHGSENFVLQGPNILVGNHIGSFKDVAMLFKCVPRPIFFTANKEIFDRDEFNLLIRRHLKRHFKEFGLTLNKLLGPIKSPFVRFISTNISKIGTIPVDISPDRPKGRSLALVENHVRQGRAVVALQGRGRLRRMYRNPYIEPFRRGVAYIAYNLKIRHGMDVPITPLAFFGTHRPLFLPCRVHLNVGPPMFIKDYLAGSVIETVGRFRSALESRVHSLFLRLIQR